MKIILFAKRFWWIFLIGFLVGGLIVYNSKATAAKEIKTKTYKVTKQDLIDSLDISGQIDAHSQATLRFQTSGLLSWVGVKEGDIVKKFQALASLDKKDLQNRMSQLLNTYSKTRWDFEQAQEDNKNWQTTGMTNEARDAIKRSLDKNQFDLNNSVLNVEAQQISLRFATLITPIAGLVTKVDSPIAGQNITPASAQFVVIDSATIYFAAVADQTEVTKLKVGSTGTVSLDSFPDKKFQGVIEAIGFTPKEGETGTVYEIKINLGVDNSLNEIKMGMTGDISFVFKETKDVLAIPTAYIKSEGDKKVVEVIKNDVKVKTEVTTGESVDGLTEILTGLNENDLIYSN